VNPYRVDYTSSAAHEISKLPPDVQPRILAAARALAGDPRPRGCVKLAGHDTGWRVRVGHHRIVYSIDDDAHVVTIGRARHRRDVYRA